MISHENFSSISLVSLGLFRSCAEEKISCKRLCVYTCCEILPTQLHPEPHIHKLTCWNKVDRSPLWLWIYCIGLYFCEEWGQTGLKPALWSTEFKHGCWCRASWGRRLYHSSERPQQVQGSYIESMILRHFSGPGSTSNSELPEGHSRARVCKEPSGTDPNDPFWGDSVDCESLKALHDFFRFRVWWGLSRGGCWIWGCS